MAVIKRDIENDFILSNEGYNKEKFGGEEFVITEFEINVPGKDTPDIVRHRTPRDEVFKRYKERSDVAILIANGLIGKWAYKPGDIANLTYDKIIKDGYTFFMSEEVGLERTGLLSLCPAIMTALKLYADILTSIKDINSNLNEIKINKDKAKKEKSEQEKDLKEILERLQKKLEDTEKVKEELWDRIINSVDTLLKIIYRGKDWRNDKDESIKPVLDASPYEYESFYAEDAEKGLEGRSYIDSVTWVVPVCLSILNLTDKDNKYIFTEDYRKISKILAKWCLKYVVESVITVNAGNEEKPVKKPVGWSFTKLKNPTESAKSLYFTYAASTLFLSFFAEYSSIIRAFKKIDWAIDICGDDVIEKKYWLNDFKSLKEALKDLKENIKNKSSNKENILPYDADDIESAYQLLINNENKEKIGDLFDFNNDLPIGYDGQEYGSNDYEDKKIGPLTKLKWDLEQIADYIWDNVRKDDKLENEFLYDNFSFKTADPTAIRSGDKTNALFSGLLLIGIIINSAYDLVIRYTSEKKDKAKYGERAYNNMQDTLLLHVQRVQRFYDKLEEEGNTFGVDALVLRFSEEIEDIDIDLTDGNERKIISNKALAEKLRKYSMSVCSLTPMLLKTNNMLSEYIVEYPQKQMGESLFSISKKRCRNKKNTNINWYWESDDYHAVLNYYYVAAIYDFYSYYEKYEKIYVLNYAETSNALIRDLDYSSKLSDYYQKTARKIIEEKENIENSFKDELKNKEIEIQNAKKEASDAKTNASTGNALVDNINTLVKDSEHLKSIDFYKKLIEGIRNEIANELSENYKNAEGSIDDEELKKIEKLKYIVKPKDETLFSLLQALFADIMLSSAIESRKRTSKDNYLYLGRSGYLKEEKETYKAIDVELQGREQLIINGIFEDWFSKLFDGYLDWKKNKE